MQLPNTEVTGSDSNLKLLLHDSLEDLSDDGLSHLLLLAKTKMFNILLEGHCQEKEAKDLVVVKFSHVHLHPCSDKKSSYLLFNALEFQVPCK